MCQFWTLLLMSIKSAGPWRSFAFSGHELPPSDQAQRGAAAGHGHVSGMI
jgi:hypothetical protein